MDRHAVVPFGVSQEGRPSDVRAKSHACCEQCQGSAPRLLGATWIARATSALWYFRCDACGWVWTVAEDGHEPVHVN
jgi:hypothetical protein